MRTVSEVTTEYKEISFENIIGIDEVITRNYYRIDEVITEFKRDSHEKRYYLIDKVTTGFNSQDHSFL